VEDNGAVNLKGRTLYIHPMTRSGARLIAATFRSIGIDAKVLPPSDTRTMKLGNMYSSGEECLPEKITLGDYLKITEMDGFDPKKTAFLMPTADGPCRFGQYSQLLRIVLKKRGLEEIAIISPSSKNGYAGIGGNFIFFFRTAWLGIVASDILRKMQLKIRPYENIKGITDTVYEKSLVCAERVLEKTGIGFGKRRALLVEALVTSRDEFRSIDANYSKDKSLIGILGEIFCRHNRFANEDMIRKLEAYGAETWIADVGEWVFYTNWFGMDNLKRWGKSLSIGMALTKLKNHIMKEDEHGLLTHFHDDFIGYEEPSETEEIVRYGEPYLPARGALGEMALSMGKAGYLYTKGVDGIIDISPFSCMNGIVSEAVYPSFSMDHNNIPCKVFYYDGINLDLDRDIGIFMELVNGYKSRKTIERRYSELFKDG
jgi:predicted nucleotide-binding protein (sugar kinase/HSP70/actin superfamily)